MNKQQSYNMQFMYKKFPGMADNYLQALSNDLKQLGSYSSIERIQKRRAWFLNLVFIEMIIIFIVAINTTL